MDKPCKIVRLHRKASFGWTKGRQCTNIQTGSPNGGTPLNRWRYEMKSYNELKAEIEAIQQQMVEAKKNERANLTWK